MQVAFTWCNFYFYVEPLRPTISGQLWHASTIVKLFMVKPQLNHEIGFMHTLQVSLNFDGIPIEASMEVGDRPSWRSLLRRSACD